MDNEQQWRETIDEQGYVVVPTGIATEQLEAVIADIFAHSGADRSDPSSWYKSGVIGGAGMIEMYHYQSMWDIRQHPNLHRIFTTILGTEKLWVSLDRANLKPPSDPAYPEYSHRGFIHWDTDIRNYPDIPFAVQGVLALTDTDEAMGGFQCVPQLYRNLDNWVAERRAEGTDFRHLDLSNFPITKVPMRAGDLVVWSTLLPHGNGLNVSKRPRLAQYITMHPAHEQDESRRQARVQSWRTCHPMDNTVFPGDPRRIEEEKGQPATLTALGRKLIGLDTWD